jgi:hypothetical protein
MKNRNITTAANEILRVIRDYFVNIYCYKLENLEEMDKFLDISDLPTLSQEEVNKLNV